MENKKKSSSEKFNKYLKRYQIAKNSDFTHTSLGNKKGSYYIQSENYDDFLNNYAKGIENNEELGITEKHKLLSPILIDLDFRYNVTKSEKDNPDRIYTMEMIDKFIEEYNNLIKEYLKPDKEYSFYIFEKSKATYYKDNKEIGKDGIHIMIPDIVTKPSVQYLFRDKCIEILRDVFSVFSNSMEDIFDEAVIEKNGWFMYKSHKPNSESYEVSKIYTSQENGGLIIDIEKLNNFKELNLINKIKLFSIRNKKFETKILSSKKDELFEFHSNLMDKEREKLTKAKIFKSTRNNKKNEILDLEIVKKFVKILNPERAERFDEWIRVGWCLRNIDHRLIDEWIEFSKKSSKYQDGECERKWNYMKLSNLGIGTLRMWTKLDNPEEYTKIIQEDLDMLLKNARTGTDNDVARVIHQMFKYEFVCSSIKKNVWYEFKDHRWKLSDCAIGLKLKMSNQVFREFMRISSKYSADASSTEDLDEQERLSKLAGNYHKIALSLKKSTNKNNYLKECGELFYHNKFEEKLDSKCHLIGFENGVFDLENYEFRPGNPDDYISFTTGIDYIEYDENSDIINDIDDFISKILPKEEMKIYLLKLFASFLNGNIKEEKFHFFTGTGANGKSKIIELYQKAFGDYCGQYNVSLLTQKRVKSNDTNSELVQSKGKRFMVLQEPSEGERINTGLLKELTGGDTIIARGLFQDPITFKPQAHMTMTCNHLPVIPSDDGGTWRRVRAVHFPSKFTENPDPSNKYEFKIDKEISLKFEDWKETFMSLLLNYYKKYVDEGIFEPEEVLAFTNEYQKENDFITEFIDECIQKLDNEDTFMYEVDVWDKFCIWYDQQGGEKSRRPKKNKLTKTISQKLKLDFTKIKSKKGWYGYVINTEDDYEIQDNEEL